MADYEIAPYGSWKSPITTDLIVSESLRLGMTALDGDDIYWVEGRPSEGGRNVLMKRSADGTITELNPSPFNARTRVHEYGGGDYVISHGTAYFSHFADQRLYRTAVGVQPEPITEVADRRYADAVVDNKRGRLICVCEDHSEREREAVNMLVSLPLEATEDMRVLASGNDFYAFPRLSPDGSRLAWTTWNHPNMPWDGCELWVGDLDASGFIHRARLVAGGASEAIFQPQWSPDGILYFISDRTGWWNIYRQRAGQIEALCPMEAEFGAPQWTFGMSTYGFVSPQRLICGYIDKSGSHLANLDTTTGKLTPMELPYNSISDIHVSPERVIFVGASSTEAPTVVELNLHTQQLTSLRRSSNVKLDPASLSLPQTIEFPTEHGLTAYAYYYAPHNTAYRAPAGELPPLLVISHGGPTNAATSSLALDTQFFTSRGFAVLAVNYGGSSGYGRAYRDRLKGQWGVVDVDDCVNGAAYLVKHGLVDGNRLAIRGGSAGGYTTLCALAYREVFKAGASRFAASDLSIFIKDTHKFESRYLSGLIGPYPEASDLYYQRSPINFADCISVPVIFFQGTDDKITPPDQTERMVEVMRTRKVPVAYLAFEGEQHGFRRAENIKRALEAEFYFYAKVFNFQLADSIKPVEIENWP